MLNNLDVMSQYNLQMTKDETVPGGLRPEKAREKLVILGGMAASCDWPRDDETWEVWGCNAMWGIAKDSLKRFRADRWFELHPWRVQSHVDKLLLEVSPLPVYMLDLVETETNARGRSVRELVPNALEFPLKALIADGLPDYYVCTFAYQLALAIRLGFKEISMVGIYLFNKREGIIERPNVEFWMGLAMGKGIKFHIPTLRYNGEDEPVPLVRAPYRYGYDYDQEKAWGEAYCLEVAKGLYPNWKST